MLHRMGYKIIERYKPSRCRVYKVYMDNALYIAKAARKSDPLSYEQVNREHDILKKLSAIAGIPHLVSFYCDVTAPLQSIILNILRGVGCKRDKIVVLIREYIHGNEKRPYSKLSKAQYDIIKKLIERCHSEGIAGLDINRPRNIIISQHGIPYIIDLGTYKRENEVTPDRFSLLKAEDMKKIEAYIDL